jgi:hypothetical protein
MSLIALIPLINKALDFGSEFVEDKDKRNQLEVDKEKFRNELLIALAQQTTSPFADAFVKIITALVALHRPIGSFGLFVFGLFNIDLMQQLASMGTVGELAVAATFGAAPSWMASRHIEKNNKIKNHFLDH